MKAIASQLLQALLLIITVIVFNFILIHIAPGDVVDSLGGDGRAETNQLLREQYGLDKPLPVQLGRYIGKVLQGDFGYSVAENRPVIEVILPRIGPTLLLTFSALGFAVLIGTCVGVIAARKPEGMLSNVVTILAIVGFAMPVFWTGILLLQFFSIHLGWLPVGGMNDLRLPWAASSLDRFLDTFKHLLLPMFSLSIIYIASYSRLARASMLEVLQSDYVRTARAKGLNETTVLFKHALRNGLIPIITVMGLQFGTILSGAILVETVFSWPGIGRLAFESVQQRDTNVLMAVLTLVSITVIAANLFTDLLYRITDPRIRTSGTSND